MIDSTPIFLIGYPRSGTTFLQSLIATQDGITSFPETHFYSVLTGHLDTRQGISTEMIPDIKERAMRMLALNDQHWSQIIAGTPTQGEHLSRVGLFHSILRVLADRQGDTLMEQTILEKTPSHAMHMEEILLDHPEARFIQICRHPVDSIASYHIKLSMGNKPLSQLIEEWQRSHDHVQAFKDLHPGRVYSLRYEDLMEARTNSMRRVMRFIGQELNVSLITDFTRQAQKYILEFESWKAENKGEANTEMSDVKPLGWKDKATIRHLLASRIKEQGYEVGGGLLQTLFNLKNGGAK